MKNFKEEKVPKNALQQEKNIVLLILPNYHWPQNSQNMLQQVLVWASEIRVNGTLANLI